ncbi:MAG: hypothetical protein AAGE85_02830 [Pseudomonadota bacterium]
MRFKEDHPFEGREFDWVATDSKGSVGYFSTAGVAPVPEICLSNNGIYEYLFEEVVGLPVVCAARVLDKSDRDIADWIAVAERGFYAYDWSRYTSRYDLVAKPSEPLSAMTLPRALRSVVTAIEVETDFRKLEYLAPGMSASMDTLG